jgi:hypothetical protein
VESQIKLCFNSGAESEFLWEFESICKTALAHESGDQGVPFSEKKPRVENLKRLSLKGQTFS